MTSATPGRGPSDAKTMAAVMAAVQAYLAAEAGDSASRGASRLNHWKTAPWQVLRGWERARVSRRRESF